MKILVLQLARFGDLYQTWPCLSALRRKFPEADIQLGLREKYQAAADDFSCVDRIVALPSKKILSPLIVAEEGVENALVEMDRYIDLFDTDYDQIINLSFSPFSSYLVEELKTSTTQVVGYDRHTDGFLKIADDSSAYFYAQVGVGGYNRLHLVDLFSMVADVELKEQDFSFPYEKNKGRTDRPYYVIHIGASQTHKTCDTKTWESIIRVLLKKSDHLVYLVGINSEKLNSSWIGTQNRVIDLCGETKLKDLFPLVGEAKALIAGDSMLVQIANLTKTKCLNISSPTVNFWETGPRVKGSRVLFYSSLKDVQACEVWEQLSTLGTGDALRKDIFVCEPQNHIQYQYTEAVSSEFQWALIRAMYMGFDYPIAEKLDIAVAISRLHELAILGLENLNEVKLNPQNQVSLGIIEEIDQLMREVARLNVSSQPIVQWFLTEKSRIGPEKFEIILDKTIDIFEQLRIVSNLYTLKNELPVSVERKDLTWK